MPKIRAVAVFCGAHPGDDPIFRQAAAALGHGMAKAGLRLIFGGGRVGLMGAVADAALAAGGEAIGVIPEFLTMREVAHSGLTELIVTDSMHTRKQRMFELSDAFVTMPGGLGTLDEAIEIITWRQLGLHDKPILLCDVAGSAAPLRAIIDAAVARGFALPDVRRLFEVVPDVPAVLERLIGAEAGAGGEPARL
ncbi:MAG TPA: TIGR00730 family Rossman fold protein [Acetobacteraceae bacterium]|nr:TIGR00730 family Rossman fold protein [Acetobacteraceae bacterium]